MSAKLCGELRNLWVVEHEAAHGGLVINTLENVVERNGQGLKNGVASGCSVVGVFKDLAHAQEYRREIKEILRQNIPIEEGRDEPNAERPKGAMA